tara:strand:- start:45333 stop:45485 length:153 start_codon:yes stop_codon:yes gene_type:complete
MLFSSKMNMKQVNFHILSARQGDELRKFVFFIWFSNSDIGMPRNPFVTGN